MADPVRIEERLIGSPAAITGAPAPRPAARSAQTSAPSFGQVLQEAQRAQSAGTLKFSAHAQTRMQSRQIALTAPDLQRIEGAVQKAAGKGARESLILLDQTALVVSIPNRTVITVVDRDHLKQSVFTNIDSAVIA